MRDGLITNNQYTVAKLPSSDDKYQYQTLSFCEINYLIKELMTTDIIVPVILSVILGMRRSEAIGSKWEYIDFNQGRIKINGVYIVCYDSFNQIKYEYWTPKTKTLSSNRECYVPRIVIDFLKALRLDQINKAKNLKNYCTDYSDYICLRSNGRLMSPDYVTKKFARLVKKIFPEKHIRFHDLRHSCGTYLHDIFGYDCKDIQTYLGHSSAAFTANTYIHTTNPRKQSIATDIDSRLTLQIS